MQPGREGQVLCSKGKVHIKDARMQQLQNHPHCIASWQAKVLEHITQP